MTGELSVYTQLSNAQTEIYRTIERDPNLESIIGRPPLNSARAPPGIPNFVITAWDNQNNSQGENDRAAHGTLNNGARESLSDVRPLPPYTLPHS
jgi:hypothetical protein